MERALGIGHGSLYRLILGLGCPNAINGAKRRLTDWIGRPSGQAAEPTAASLSLEQL